MFPRLDYYVGRPVTQVRSEDEGWTIYLEGGVKIKNYDPDREKPEGLKDMKLSTVSMSGGGTSLQFQELDDSGQMLVKQSTVHLTPDKYSLSDENYNEGDEIYPQRSDAQAPEIEEARPEEPADRLQEGPEEPVAGLKPEEEAAESSENASDEPEEPKGSSE